MALLSLDVTQVRKGDIVRFKAYALRVDSEPRIGRGSIVLEGRSSADGCPWVRKSFMAGRIVTVERDENSVPTAEVRP